MARHLIRALTIVCCALIQLSPAPGGAQASKGTDAARVEFDRGAEAVKQKQVDAALAAFRKAIEIDPTFFEAHRQYVSTTRRQIGFDKAQDANAKLRATYSEWLAAQPGNAVLHYFLGDLEEDPDTADVHFAKAIELDPKFVEAYRMLAYHAQVRGENAQWRAYLAKAADSRPDDAACAFDYADSFARADSLEWKKRMLATVDRFPTHERAAEALYGLGEAAPTEAESIRYLERVRRDYPPARYGWSINASELLFEIYSRSEPEKAVAVARSIVSAGNVESGWDWTKILAMGEALVKTRALVAAGKGADALAVLNAVDPPRWVRGVPLDIAKADAERAMGEPGKAYARLVDLVAKAPKPDLVAALNEHAKRMNVRSERVGADVRSQREKRAKPAEDFELENYLDGSKATLAGYRGKVVLLNFWFPG